MTIKDYYDQIIEIKEGKSELDELTPYNENATNLMADLNSTSKVAMWRLWCWIMATLAWMLNLSFEKHKAEVNTLISSNRHGTEIGYQNDALNFQLGHALIWNGKQYVYDTIDPQAKIIKRCAVGMHQGVLRFKVVKEINGVLTPLKPSEYSAFNTYIFNKLYPGTNYIVISSEADLLKLNSKIYVDPQIIDLQGKHVVSGESVIETAINTYVKNLLFNGRMNIQRLTDAIQNVEGVKDIHITESYYKYGSLDWTLFAREIEPLSGYMDLDLSSSNIEYHEYT